MQSNTIWAAWGFSVLLGGAMLVLQTRPVGAAAPDTATLEQRIAALEQLVVHNPDKPNVAVTDRLDTIERSLKMESAPTDIKTIDDLKEALVRSEVRQQTMARKIAEIESRNATAARSSADDKIVADLKKNVTAQERDVKDLSNRVRKIESSNFGRGGI